MRSSSPEAPRKRGRIACIACRQAKVRCDLVSIPCSRCSKLDIDCSVNAGYKRTNKRDKVNELEEDVQALKSIVKAQNRNHDDDHVHRSDRQVSLRSGSNTDLEVTIAPTTTSHSVDERLSTYCLGDICLGADESVDLFSLYFEKYHPHLPILDSSRTCDAYYSLSPTLFWTIIAVALRKSRERSSLFDRLVPAVCGHLWNEIGSSRKNRVGVDASDVHEIQALIIQSTWPLPYTRLWSDRSLIQSNLALTSAMHIGLNRPGFDYEYVRNLPRLSESTFQERSSVWIACYCLSISLALEAGHTPLVPATDWLINKVCLPLSQIDVPHELRHHAMIEKQANDAFQALIQMNENPAAIAQEPAFFDQMSVSDGRFESTYEQFRDDMSLMNKMRCLGSMLLLQLMYFLADQQRSETRRGLLRAYATSINILKMLVSEDHLDEQLSAVPQILMRIILRAAFTIERLHFSTFQQDIDMSTGKVLFDTAILILRQMSASDGKADQPKRIADALRLTWKHMDQHPDLLQRDPTLSIRSRLGASMQYDCLFYYREAVKNMTEPSKGDRSLDVPSAEPSAISTDFPQHSNSTWSVPSLETFLEADFSWLDSLVTAGPFPSA